MIKLCELKRAIESSPRYEEAARPHQITGWYHAESAGVGDPSSQKVRTSWSIFDMNLVYMNVDIWHTAFQTLKGLYVHNNDDDDANNRYKDNKATTTSQLLAEYLR